MKNVVAQAINKQINSELTASYAYLAMSAWCAQHNFVGAAHWLRLQSHEEYGHAMKLLDFVLARGGEVELKSLDEPRRAFQTVGEIFETALTQEHAVSSEIDALYELAFREKAFAEVAALEWFLTEQVEEEKTSREIVAKFRMVGNDAPSLLDLDRELGARVASERPAAR